MKNIRFILKYVSNQATGIMVSLLNTKPQGAIMSNSLIKQNIIKIVATTALTFGLVGASFAASDKQNFSRYQNGLWIPGYGMVSSKTVDSLKLNDEQNKLLEQAREFSKELHQKNTKDFKETKSKDKVINPHAANDRMLQRQESANKWLAVWDSLDNDQKEVVSDAVISNKSKKHNFKNSRKHQKQSKFQHGKNYKNNHNNRHRNNS